MIRLRKVFKYSNNPLERRQESQRFEDQVFESTLQGVVEQKQEGAPFNLLYTSYYHLDNIFEIGLA